MQRAGRHRLQRLAASAAARVAAAALGGAGGGAPGGAPPPASCPLQPRGRVGFRPEQQQRQPQWEPSQWQRRCCCDLSCSKLPQRPRAQLFGSFCSRHRFSGHSVLCPLCGIGAEAAREAALAAPAACVACDRWLGAGSGAALSRSALPAGQVCGGREEALRRRLPGSPRHTLPPNRPCPTPLAGRQATISVKHTGLHSHPGPRCYCSLSVLRLSAHRP